MYFVILILLVPASARDISQNFNYEPRQERFERPFINPPAQPNYRSRHESVQYNRQNGHVNLNEHEQLHSDSNVRRWNGNPNEGNIQENFNSQGQFHETNNREIFSSNRNERNRNENPNQGIPYGQFEPNIREFSSNDRNDRGFQERNPEHSHVNLNDREPFHTQNNRGLSDNDYSNERNRNENPNQGIPYGQFEPNNRAFSSNDRNDRRFQERNTGHSHVNSNDRELFNTQNNRGISDNDYSNERNRNENPNQGIPYGQFEPNNRAFSSTDRNDRRFQERNPGHSHVNLNDREPFNTQNNRGLSDNGSSNVNYNSQGRSHDNTGSVDINMAFDGRGDQNRREQSNLNIPRQSFNINNEYSNRDVANNRSSTSNRDEKYNQNVLNARTQQDEITMDEYNKETQNNHRHSNNQSNNGIVPFINNLSNNTNQNRNQSTNKNHRNSGFRQTDQRTKTVIENEVTEIPLGNEDKGNRTMDKDEWVWGVEETTTMSPVTLDDRAAFSGDHCPTGYARFKGTCVPED